MLGDKADIIPFLLQSNYCLVYVGAVRYLAAVPEGCFLSFRVDLNATYFNDINIKMVSLAGFIFKPQQTDRLGRLAHRSLTAFLPGKQLPNHP